jgi:DNA polymerase I-like protein with 3'-5' exonuclease and polymerase domains
MMIHDSLWVESPGREAEEVRSIMHSVMTTAGELDVPLKVEFE